MSKCEPSITCAGQVSRRDAWSHKDAPLPLPTQAEISPSSHVWCVSGHREEEEEVEEEVSGSRARRRHWHDIVTCKDPLHWAAPCTTTPNEEKSPGPVCQAADRPRTRAQVPLRHTTRKRKQLWSCISLKALKCLLGDTKGENEARFAVRAPVPLAEWQHRGYVFILVSESLWQDSFCRVFSLNENHCPH